MPAVAKRESPTYLNMGTNDEMLVRLERDVRDASLECYGSVFDDHAGPGLGKFLGYLVSRGTDYLIHMRTKGRRKALAHPANLDEDLYSRMERPIRDEAQALYQQVYGGLPGPGLGQFIGYLIIKGIEHIQQKPRPRRRK